MLSTPFPFDLLKFIGVEGKHPGSKKHYRGGDKGLGGWNGYKGRHKPKQRKKYLDKCRARYVARMAEYAEVAAKRQGWAVVR